MIQASMFFTKELPSGGSKIPVGIHTGNVSFSGITFEDGYYDINFTSDSGQTIHRRLFKPTGNKPKEGETVTEAMLREEGRNITSLADLLKVLLGEETAAQVSAPDYNSFMAKAMLILNNSKGIKVNLKVVPDYRENKYPELPAYRYVERFEEGKGTELAFTKKETEAIEKMHAARQSRDNSGDEVSSVV